MSAEKAEKQNSNSVKTETKKRSTYKKGNFLDFPKWCDLASYGYRWLSANKLAAASDGYESRGWSVAKDPSGQITRRDDLILGQMPRDMYEDMLDQKREDAQTQTQMVLERQAANDEMIKDQMKSLGGKVKFTYEQS